MKQFFVALGKALVDDIHKAVGLVILLSTVSVFGFPTQWISCLVLGLYVLYWGEKWASIIVVAAMLPFIVFAWFADANMGVLGINVLQVLGVWGGATVYRRLQSWSLVIEMVLICATILVLLIHFLFPDITVWWMEQFEQVLSGAKDSVISTRLPVITKIATGVQAVSLSVFVCLIVACGYGWWRTLVQAPATLKQQLLQFRSSYLSLALGGLLVVLAVWGWSPALDALPIALLSFLFDGMSLVHSYVIVKPNTVLWLGLFYVILLIMPYFVFAVVLLGVIDCVVDLRHRINFG